MISFHVTCILSSELLTNEALSKGVRNLGDLSLMVTRAANGRAGHVEAEDNGHMGGGDDWPHRG